MEAQPSVNSTASRLPQLSGVGLLVHGCILAEVAAQSRVSPRRNLAATEGF